MINRERLKAQRIKLGLTQGQVAELTQKQFNCGTQQGYRKIESGEAASSKYLPYYCKALGLALSEVDSAMSEALTSTKDKAVEAIQSLPESDQVEIALNILKKAHNKEV